MVRLGRHLAERRAGRRSESYAEWCRLGVGCFDATRVRRCRELESQELLIIVVRAVKIDRGLLSISYINNHNDLE